VQYGESYAWKYTAPAFCFHEPSLRLIWGIGAIGLVLEAVAASGGLEAPLEHLPVKPLPVDNFDVPGGSDISI